MSAVLRNKAAAACAARSRGYALRFGPQVPIEVIGGCIEKASSLLSREVPGRASFSHVVREEVIAGERVASSYLRAGDEAWSAFQERDGGFVPELAVSLDRVVAWPASIRASAPKAAVSAA